jgi:putative hemolysin
MDSTFTVDIDKLFSDKNPGLYRILPGFVIKYLKKIIHQDDVNEILVKYGNDYSGKAFNRKVLEHLNISYNVEKEENLPRGGRYIFASNHPLGALDGIVLMDFIGKNYDGIKFVVNDILMYLKPLQELFAPVNKLGKQSADYVRQIDELYSSDKQVLYFPAGMCSRKIRGQIIDLEWKRSFAAKAIKYRRDIVPLYFDGRNSGFFYALANIRKFLGIRANVEMLYLADEFFKKKNSCFTLRVGKPVSCDALREMGIKPATDYIRKCVYELK